MNPARVLTLRVCFLFISGISFLGITSPVNAVLKSDLQTDKERPRKIIVRFKDDSLVGAVAQELHEGGQRIRDINSASKLDELNSRYKVKRIRRFSREEGSNKTRKMTSGQITPLMAQQILNKRKELLINRATERQQKRIRKMRSGSKLPSANERLNTDSGKMPYLGSVYVFEFGAGINPDSVCQDYANDPDVKYCQPDTLMTIMSNDYYFSSEGSWGQPYKDLWGLHRINAVNAWNMSKGVDVTVAVVDTGLDYRHEDIQANVWHNSEEIQGNNIDDDHNGYVDDDRGYDFTSCTTEEAAAGYCQVKLPDNDPLDGMGHGTHVSGTIAAVSDNGVGIVGIAPQAKIMALKGLSDRGSGWTSDLAEAIIYAVDNGADVINNSWGASVSTQNPLLEEAVRYAYALGAVVVFSAGNSDDDLRARSPANMREVIAVGAVTERDTKASFSSFGPRLDIVAPGGSTVISDPSPREVENILSLRAQGTSNDRPDRIVGERYVRFQGTSMAAPHVSGAVALLRSLHPEYSPDDIIQIIRVSSIDLGLSGFDREFGYGLLNAETMLKRSAPLKVKIDQPADWVDLNSDTAVRVTARGAGFLNYRLLIADEPFPVVLKQLGSLSTVAANGTLFTTLTPDNWGEGLHNLKLQVMDTTQKFYEDDIYFFKPFKMVREKTVPNHQLIAEVNDRIVLWWDYSNYFTDTIAKPVNLYATEIESGKEYLIARDYDDTPTSRYVVTVKGSFGDWVFWRSDVRRTDLGVDVLAGSYAMNIKTGETKSTEVFDSLFDSRAYSMEKTSTQIDTNTYKDRAVISYRDFNPISGMLSSPIVVLQRDAKIAQYTVSRNHLTWYEEVGAAELNRGRIYLHDLLSGEIREIKRFIDDYSGDKNNYYRESKPSPFNLVINSRYVGFSVDWKRVINGNTSYGTYIEVYDLVKMTSQKFDQPRSTKPGQRPFVSMSLTNNELLAFHDVGNTNTTVDYYLIDLINGARRVVNKYVSDSIGVTLNYLANNYRGLDGAFNWTVGALGYQPVEWVETKGSVVSKTSLFKKNSSALWDASAVSAQFISGDCAVRFTIPLAKTLNVGLSENNAPGPLSSSVNVKYGVMLTEQGLYDIYQDGISVKRSVNYKSGDVFIIERINGILYFRQNGQEMYKTTTTNFNDLLVVAGLYSNGASVKDASMRGLVRQRRNLYTTPPTVPTIVTKQAVESKLLNFSFQVGNFIDMPLSVGARLSNGQSIDSIGAKITTNATGLSTFSWTPDYDRQGSYSVQILASNGEMVNNRSIFNISVPDANPDFRTVPVKWVEAKRVDVNNPNIVMNAVSGEGLASGAVSDDMFSGDGGVDFTIKPSASGNISLVCGLASSHVDESELSIDYGLEFTTTKNIFVKEKSVSPTGGVPVGKWKEGDVFSIKRTAEKMTFWQNGTLLYTSPRTSREALMVAASLRNYLGSGVSNAQMYGYLIPRADINHAPVVSPSIQVTTMREGASLSVKVKGADAENARVSFQCTMQDQSPISQIGASFIDYGDSTGELTITPPSNMIQGQYKLVLTGTDPGGKTDSENLYITILDTLPPDSTRPSAPVAPVISNVGGSWVDLWWQASTDNIGVAGYYIYRNNLRVASVPTNSYRDTGLSFATAYQYQIKSFDAGGNESDFSPAVWGTTQPFDVTFSSTPFWGDVPLYTEFKVSLPTDNNSYSVSMTYGDGESSAVQNGVSGNVLFSHVYLNPGMYNAGVQVTNNQNQTAISSQSIMVTGNSSLISWTAYAQTPGYTTWSTTGLQDDSTFRILIKGSKITKGGAKLRLRFKGTKAYAVKKVSVVQRDGTTLDGVDSTFKQVTFGGSTWANGGSVPANGVLYSDWVSFPVTPGKDIFVTLWSPSGNGMIPYIYNTGEATFWTTPRGTDKSAIIDWQGGYYPIMSQIVAGIEIMEVSN